MFDFSGLKDIFSKYGKFVYLVLGKWYYLIAPSAMYAAWKFLEKFEATGLPDRIRGFIATQISILLDIVERCTPYIGDLTQLYQCLDK